MLLRKGTTFTFRVCYSCKNQVQYQGELPVCPVCSGEMDDPDANKSFVTHTTSTSVDLAITLTDD